MKILGVYCGHDSNLSCVDTSRNEIIYLKEERESGTKHHCIQENKQASPFFINSVGQIIPQDIKLRKEAAFNYLKNKCRTLGINPDIIVICGSKQIGLGGCSIDELYKETDNIEYVNAQICESQCRVFFIDHHYAHVLSCWPIIPTNKVDFGISIDGVGDHGLCARVIKTPYNPEVVYNETRTSIGTMLTRIGRELMDLKGASIDIAGKVMGAQAYGVVDLELVKKIDKEYLFSDMANHWRHFKPRTKFGQKEFNDWLATMHYLSEEFVLDIFSKCSDQSTITYSGGVAQNTLINDTLFSRYNLSIPPHCYDGGLSLGCIELARIFFNLDEFSNKNFPYWQFDRCEEKPSNDTLELVAKLLSQGKIIGWFQGSGELGPRALGNRSILMDPRIEDGKNILNRQVKKREYWRPYAPSVLEEEAGKWFNVESSPYMLRATSVKSSLINSIPSVVHIDNTSRIQTVNRCQNDIFYDLIYNFYKITQIPMLLNTSLNANGQPIFSTKDQCIELLNNSDIDLVCIGNRIYNKYKLL